MAKKCSVHKYQRRNIAVNQDKDYYVLACVNCTSYIRPDLAVGKPTICWRCGEEFILKNHQKRMRRPHCNDCTKPRVTKVDERHDDILEKLIRDLT